MNAEVIGRKQQEEFVNDRNKESFILLYNTEKNLYYIKSFIENRKDTRWDMFNRVAEEDIDLKELSFSLSPTALSLSSLDGSLYKGCKASLLHRLEESIPLSDLQSLVGAVQIFDAMVIMQQIPASVNTLVTYLIIF